MTKDKAVDWIHNRLRYIFEKLKTSEFGQQRHDVIWANKNQVARFKLVLHKKFDEICYSEYTYPAQGRLFHGVEFENYVDINKKDMKQLTYDQLLLFLKKAGNRKDELKEFLRSKNIPFREGLWF